MDAKYAVITQREMTGTGDEMRDAEREALDRIDMLIAETIRSELAKWAPVVAWFVRKAVDPRGFTDDPRDTRFRYCN